MALVAQHALITVGAEHTGRTVVIGSLGVSNARKRGSAGIVHWGAARESRHEFGVVKAEHAMEAGSMSPVAGEAHNLGLGCYECTGRAG